MPGEVAAISLTFSPTSRASLDGWLTLSSNDPKGDVLVEMHGTVAIPERVYLDLDPEPENQAQVQVTTDPSEEIPVQLFVAQLPEVQAVRVRVQFDPAQVGYVVDSWKPGSFIDGGIILREEAEIEPGLVEVSVGTLGGRTGTGDGYLGSMTFRTAATFPGKRGEDQTVLTAVRVWYLTGEGQQDSLHVLAEVTLAAKGDTWPDLDGNGEVQFADYLMFLRAFKKDSTSPGWDEELPHSPFPQTPYRRFDVDGDGSVGFVDFLRFGQAYREAVSAQ